MNKNKPNTKPRNLTAKQEAFAQAIASGHTLADAFRIAYDSAKNYRSENALHVEATRTAENPKVSLRIAELKQPKIYHFEYNREQLLRDAYSLYEQSESDSVRLGALRLIADVRGEIVRRNEVKSEHTEVKLSLEEARAILRQRGISPGRVDDIGDSPTIEGEVLQGESTTYELPEHDEHST